MAQIQRFAGFLTLSLLALAGLFSQPAAADAIGPNDFSIGKADAPIQIIEYASLTCPHCAAFDVQTFPSLKSAYIDTGKVRLAYRDFPLDDFAVKASILARCGGPDRYFGFIDVLFRQQNVWATGPDPLAALAQIGLLGGVSADEFKACMNDKAIENAVLASRLQAVNEYKVDSTPTFIINGKVYGGARSFDEMKSLLDGLLSGTAVAATTSSAPSSPAAPGSPATSPAVAATMGNNIWLVGSLVIILAAVLLFFFLRRGRGSAR